MKTKTLPIISLSLATASLAFAQTSTSAPTGAPYNESPVWTLTMIKTKAGLSDDYFK
jgi:hypothetical protein